MRNRVAAGAALLDERRPGWAEEVDTVVLWMGSCVICVLGQVFGRYGDGLDELGLSLGDRHGFNLNDDDFTGTVSGDYLFTVLGDYWRAEIAVRLVLQPLGA